mmetsp:Transcript_4337/g.7403  ORF Transcript_4337/g.7403 Transcript_4337/m.7403 type:complete len:216 (-) Transcript_4337:704-1351(-)
MAGCGARRCGGQPRRLPSCLDLLPRGRWSQARTARTEDRSGKHRSRCARAQCRLNWDRLPLWQSDWLSRLTWTGRTPNNWLSDLAWAPSNWFPVLDHETGRAIDFRLSWPSTACPCCKQSPTPWIQQGCRRRWERRWWRRGGPVWERPQRLWLAWSILTSCRLTIRCALRKHLPHISEAQAQVGEQILRDIRVHSAAAHQLGQLLHIVSSFILQL